VSGLSYPSDRSDPAWSRVRPHIVPARLRGRPCPEQRWREYLDAILSVVRTGCPWRALPHDVGVHWSSAHKHFLRWARRGRWQRILDDLREHVRQDVGRASSPTAGVADSCSVKSTPAAGPRESMAPRS
jgi:transposase